MPRDRFGSACADGPALRREGRRGAACGTGTPRPQPLHDDAGRYDEAAPYQREMRANLCGVVDVEKSVVAEKHGEDVAKANLRITGTDEYRL